MSLPSQAAPVSRTERLEPEIDLKDMVMIGADPGDPSPFRLTDGVDAVYRDLSS